MPQPDDRYEDDQPEEEQAVQEFFGVLVKVADAEAFLSDAKSNKSVKLLLAIAEGLKQTSAELSLGNPQPDLPSELLQMARGSYCNSKSLLSIPETLQTWVDAYREQEAAKLSQA